MSGLKVIQCSGCLREREQSRRDSILCQECADEQSRKLDEVHQRVAALTPQQRQVEADALFARIKSAWNAGAHV